MPTERLLLHTIVDGEYIHWYLQQGQRSYVYMQSLADANDLRAGAWIEFFTELLANAQEALDAGH